jgi:hypothetical protein
MERTNNFMCISFLYFYKIKGHKVKVVKWNEVMKKYLVQFDSGLQQYFIESLLEATDEKVENDKEWGKQHE